MNRPTLGDTFRAYCGDTVSVTPHDMVEQTPARVCSTCTAVVVEMLFMPDAAVDIAAVACERG